MTAIEPQAVLETVTAVLREAAHPALFLDRDGTICELVPYLADPSGVRLIPGAGPALRAARDAGFKLVVVTNQAGIARGYFTPAQMDAVHQALQDQLAVFGVRIDRFLACPHHPDITGGCACRKPQPGMLRRAAAELGLDLAVSTMIGDTLEDMGAGAAAGCRTILVQTGYGAEQSRDRAIELPAGCRVAADLPEAIRVTLADFAPGYSPPWGSGIGSGSDRQR